MATACSASGNNIHVAIRKLFRVSLRLSIFNTRQTGTMVVTAVITEDSKYLHLKAEKPVLDLPHAENTAGRVVPIEHSEDSKADFGAEIYGIDLNTFTDADFDFISDALHKWKLLVFKEQPEMLKPQQQYLLTAKYDAILEFWKDGANTKQLRPRGNNGRLCSWP